MIIAGPVLVLIALGVVSWLAGSEKGRGLVSAAGSWLWACLVSAWAWLVALAAGKNSPSAAGSSPGKGKPAGGGKSPATGKPADAARGKGSRGAGVTARVKRGARWVGGKARAFLARGKRDGEETPEETSPEETPAGSPTSSPTPGKGNTRQGKGDTTQVSPTVTVKTTTTVTRTTRRTTTPKDYTPHRAGDSGVSNTRESLRSHTVYGQTLAMVPAVTGTVAGYAFLIKRHRDEGEQHGLQGHAIALWDIAVQCAAAAEVAAEKAAQDPNDPGLRAAAERALDAAVEAVRDAAHFQATSLAALFAASDGSVTFLIPTIPLSGLRAAA